MPWPGTLAASVTPLGSFTGDLVSYILSYGPMGIGVLVAGFLLYRGWVVWSPARQAQERATCRADLEQQIAGLKADLDRVRAERDKNGAERDDALRMARDQLVPLLLNFTAATNSLLPILQDLTRRPGGGP